MKARAASSKPASPTSRTAAIKRQRNPNAAPIVGKHYPTGRIATFLSRWPSLSVLASFLPLFVLTIVLAATSYPETDADIEDFVLSRFEPVENAHRMGEMVSGWKTVMGLINATGVCTAASFFPRNQPVYRIEVRAAVKSNDYDDTVAPEANQGNMLSEHNMRVLQGIEQGINGMSDYTRVCYTTNCKNGNFNAGVAPQCAPMSSLSGYFFPGNFLSYTAGNNGVGIYEDNGLGEVYQVPYERVIARMMRNTQATWYVDPGFSRERPIARAIRFQVIFGAPVYLYDGKQSTRRQFLVVARKVATQLAGILEDVNKNNRHLQVSAGGDIMASAILRDALADEWYFLMAAVIIIVVVTYLRTRGIMYTLGAAIGLIFTYTGSITIYMLPNDRTIPFLTTTSIFLMTGIALHVALSIHDCFKVSGKMFTTGRRNDLTVPQRVSYTFRHACVSASVTELITIVMFAGCLVTPFEGAQDFAKLLIIQLAVTFYLTWTYYVGIAIMHHWYFSGNDRLMQRQREILDRQAERITNEARRHPLIRQYLADQEANVGLSEAVYSADMKGVAERQKSRKRNVAHTRSLLKVLHQLKEEAWAMVPFVGSSASAVHFSAIGPIDSNGQRPNAAAGGGDAVEAFDETAFATAEEVAAGRLLYTSDRMVPPKAMIHLPPASLFAYQGEVVEEVRRDERSHQENTGERLYSSSDSGNVSTSNLPPSSGTSALEADAIPPRLRALRQNSWFVDFGEVRRANEQARQKERKQRARNAAAADGEAAGQQQAPSPVDPQEQQQAERLLNTQLESKAHFTQAMNHWQEVARRVGITQGTEIDATVNRGVPPPLLLGFVAQSLVKSTDYAKVVTVVRRFPTPQRPAQLSPEAAEEEKLARRRANEETRSILTTLTQRWRQRADAPRRFLILGKRVGETRADKDARVLAKAASPNTPSWTEQRIAHLYVPFINKARWPLVVATAVIAIIFSVVASRGQYQDSGPVRLTQSQVLQAYDGHERYFRDTPSSCDGCSAYFQPTAQYRSLTRFEIALTCPLSDNRIVNQFVDICLTCNGTRSSCVGVCGANVYTYPGYTIDSCGVCRRNVAGRCDCTSPTDCGYCELNAKVQWAAGVYTGGTDCNTTCKATECDYCDPNTGECLATTCASNGNLVNGACVCNSLYEGEYCHLEKLCSWRGRRGVSPADGSVTCLCVGNWVGPNCQFCNCRNGGTCDPETGKCRCPRNRIQSRCTSCAAGCFSCEPWTAAQSSTLACVPEFCSASDVAAGIVCDACKAPSSASTNEATNAADCWMSSGYYWDSTSSRCVRERGGSGNTSCKACRGFWSGAMCDKCDVAVDGAVCDPDGSAVACDGMRYQGEQLSSMPRVDKCGFCVSRTKGRPSVCQRPQVDCKGNCSEHWVEAFVTITPLYEDVVTVNNLLMPILQQFCRATSEVAILRSPCFASEYTEPTVDGKRLSDYVLASGNAEDMGFDSYGRMKYMRLRVVLNWDLSQPSASIDQSFKDLQADIKRNTDGRYEVLVSSDAWTAARSNLAVSVALRFIVFLGLSLTITVLLAMTLSLRLALISVVCIGGAVACTLGVIVAAKWEFNAVILCCFPGILAIPLCHICHMALHYMDRLEDNQLQLFARETSTKEAVRSMMSRTMMTLIGSCVASAIVCIPTSFSKVYAMYVVSMTMLIAHLWALLFAAVLLPGCMCALGPVTTARHVVLTFIVAVVCLIIIASLVLASDIGVGSRMIFSY